MPSSRDTEQQLEAVLKRARTAGFLGPGPLRVHSDHARAFEARIPKSTRSLLDLGSGGGVPGLPLFFRLPQTSGVLLDASEKRCAFLSWAVAELALVDRVAVIRGRAEDLGHDPDLRGRFDVVTCRGFGPPAATVEGAVGFLSERGLLVISEPPSGRSWSPTGLAGVGLVQRPVRQTGRSPSESGLAEIVVLERAGEVPRDLPRPLRRQRSRPLTVLVEGGA